MLYIRGLGVQITSRAEVLQDFPALFPGTHYHEKVVPGGWMMLDGPVKEVETNKGWHVCIKQCVFSRLQLCQNLCINMVVLGAPLVHTHKKGIHMDTQVAMIVGIGSYHSSKGRCCCCKLQDSSRFNLRKSSLPFQNEEIIICPLVSLGYNLYNSIRL